MLRHATFLLAVSWIASLSAQKPAPGAGRPWDPDVALARLRLINLGSYQMKQSGQPPLGVNDITLCIRAMQEEDEELVTGACRGLGRMAGKPFFRKIDAGQRVKIVDMLITRLDGDSDPTAVAATRALSEFDGRAKAMRMRFIKPEVVRGSRLVSPAQSRRIIIKSLAMAMRREAPVQQCAGALLSAFADDVNQQVHSEICRVLLAAIGKHQKATDQRGLVSLKAALAAVPTPDRKIAEEKVSLFLPEAKRLQPNHWSVYSKADCLRALARCVHALAGERRREVVDYLVAAARDGTLAFMTTSGVRSPHHHHGALAVAVMAPHLNAGELEAAAKAVADMRAEVERGVKTRGGGRRYTAKDPPSMFGRVERAIADRRRRLK